MTHEKTGEGIRWKEYEAGLSIGEQLYYELSHMQMPGRDLHAVVTLGIFGLMIKCYSEMKNPRIEATDIVSYETLRYFSQNETLFKQIESYLATLGLACYPGEWEYIRKELIECGVEKDEAMLLRALEILAGIQTYSAEHSNFLYVVAAIQVILSAGRMSGTGLSNLASIPIEVMLLLNSMINIKPGDVCYGATDDCGALLALLSVGKKCTDIFSCNKQNDRAAFAMIQMMSNVEGKSIFEQFEQPCAPCDPSEIREKCDYAVAFTPFYRQLFPKPDKLLRLYDKSECIAWWPEHWQANQWIYARHIAAALNENGRGYIFMPLGTMSRGGNEIEVRKLFIKDNLVDMVVEFPGGTFGQSNASAALLVIQKNRKNGGVYMVNLSGKAGKRYITVNTRFHTVDFKGLAELSQIIENRTIAEGLTGVVDYDEIAHNAYSFSPSAYVFEKKQIVVEKVENLVLEMRELDFRYQQLNEEYKSAVSRYRQMSENWQNHREKSEEA